MKRVSKSSPVRNTPLLVLFGALVGGLAFALIFVAKNGGLFSPNEASVYRDGGTEAASRLTQVPRSGSPPPTSLFSFPPLSSSEKRADAAAGTPVQKTFEQALALVLVETDSAQQSDRIAEILKRWAQDDPDAAAQWIKGHSAFSNEQTLGALFDGLSAHPEKAVIFAQRLSQSNPDQARDYGYALIFALSKVAGFDQAASYATNDASRWQPDLVIAAFHEWGRQQPEAALVSAIHLPDTSTRQTAIQSVLSGWSRGDPEGMAEAAINFPAGAEKTSALIKAVRAWFIKDPEKARDWIMTHDSAISAAEVALRQD